MPSVVRPLDRGNAGNGPATTGVETVDEIGTSGGDSVTIPDATGHSVVRVRPSQSHNSRGAVVGIDSHRRRPSGGTIDEQATVERADVAPAERVTVALPEGLRGRGGLGPYLRNKLADRAVQTGDTAPGSFGFGPLARRFGRRVPAATVGTAPDETITTRV